MADDDAKDAKKGGGKKKIAMILAVVLLAGGGYFMMGRGGGSAEAAGPPKPEKGTVTKLDPIYLNLADGRYLKLGIALQATKKNTAEMDGAEALDAAIRIFSNRTMKDLTDVKARTKAQNQLTEAVQEAYGEDKVMDVYFTEFVMQ